MEAVIVGISNIDVARIVDADVVWPRQVAPFAEIHPIEVEDLDPIVFSIADQDPLVRQHEHRVRNVEGPGLIARFTPGGASVSCAAALVTGALAALLTVTAYVPTLAELMAPMV